MLCYPLDTQTTLPPFILNARTRVDTGNGQKIVDGVLLTTTAVTKIPRQAEKGRHMWCFTATAEVRERARASSLLYEDDAVK